MNSESGLALQAEIVGRLINIAPSAWKRIFMNYEASYGEDGVVGCAVLFAVTKGLIGKARRVDISLNGDLIQAIHALARLLMSSSDVRELTIDLIVSRSGPYKYQVDYTAPIRLNGNYTAEPRYLRYVTDEPLLRQLAAAEGRV